MRHATGTTADWPFTAGSCGGSLEVAKRFNRAANVFVERSVIPVQELKDRLRREEEQAVVDSGSSLINSAHLSGSAGNPSLSAATHAVDSSTAGDEEKGATPGDDDLAYSPFLALLLLRLNAGPLGDGSLVSQVLTKLIRLLRRLCAS